MSIAPLPGKDLTTPAQGGLRIQIRYCQIGQERASALSKVKKKKLSFSIPDQRIQSEKVKSPSRWMTGPFLW